MPTSFTDAIYLATQAALKDPRVHVLGLGATYKNGLDGTMKDLAAEYPSQVHDTPCSEAAVTGAAIGMATNGLRPLVHHGRIEFALYAMNQILTEAANWNYMFGGDYPCPLTLRICIGRQWGNGPAHTRAHKALFAVPGLKVVVPSTPLAARDLLTLAMKDNNPVVYLEPRWLYKTKQTLPDSIMMSTFQGQVLRAGGNDIAFIGIGDTVLECLKAAKILETVGIDAKVIDAVSVYPIDYEGLRNTVGGRKVIIADSGTPAYSLGSEFASRLGPETYGVTSNDSPCPTAPALTGDYYPTYTNIVKAACHYMGCPVPEMPEKTFTELNLPPTQDFDEFFV